MRRRCKVTVSMLCPLQGADMMDNPLNDAAELLSNETIRTRFHPARIAVMYLYSLKYRNKLKVFSKCLLQEVNAFREANGLNPIRYLTRDEVYFYAAIVEVDMPYQFVKIDRKLYLKSDDICVRIRDDLKGVEIRNLMGNENLKVVPVPPLEKQGT